MTSRAINVASVALLAVLLAVMVYFDLVFTGQLPDHYLVTGWNDLILHVGAFALLSTLVFSLQGLRFSTVTVLLGMGAVFEISQIFIPAREVSVSDLGANISGVLLIAVLIRLGFLNYIRKILRLS